jgi:hypothetical protein
MTGMTRARIALVMVAASALVLAATAAARVHAGAPIVIGWAFDSKGAMAPFDGPALAAATLRVKQIDARGGNHDERNASPCHSRHSLLLSLGPAHAATLRSCQKQRRGHAVESLTRRP